MPSLTELAVELGLAGHLVARTGFCVHPAAALEHVPKVGGTKDVDLTALRRQAPTHVLVNVDETRLETVATLRSWSPAPHVVVTHPCRPEHNLELVDQLAATFAAVPGVRERAAALKSALAFELGAIGPEGRTPCRVLYLIWRRPWMTVARDTYLSAMLARVGWATLPEVEGGPTGAARYPTLRGDEPWLATVDRVLLSSEPYRFDERHVAEAQALAPHAKVQLVDGELLSWYGPRAVAGLRYLRGLADDCG